MRSGTSCWYFVILQFENLEIIYFLTIPLSVLFQDLPANNEFLYLVRSFKDTINAGIPIESLDRILGHVSDAAVDLFKVVE